MRTKLPLFLASLLILASGLQAAPAKKSEAIFTSVRGNVEVTKGKETSRARQGATVSKGDKIVTGRYDRATLQLSDGSELRIDRATEFEVEDLSTSSKDKKVRFKLLLGRLWAQVKKLSTPRSTFEIEAGGVVCGVRGTSFAVLLKGGGDVKLEVDEGTVYSKGKDGTKEWKKGDKPEFKNGKLKGDEEKDEGKKKGKGKDKDKKDMTLKGKKILQNYKPGGSLGDFNRQFGRGLATNNDNSYNDPRVGGGVKVNVRINIDPTEALP